MFKATEIVKSVLQLLAIALVVWLAYTIRGLIVYLIIASLFALLAKPFTNWLADLKIGRFKLPRPLCAASTVFLLLGVFIAIAQILVPILLNELAVLKGIDFGKAYATLVSEIEDAQVWLANYNIALSESGYTLQKALNNFLSVETAEATISGLLGGLGNLAIAFFSIVFILFFFLKERNLMEYTFTNLMSETLAGHMRNMMPKIKRTMFRYSVGLTLQMIGIFLIVYVGLTIAGIKSAMVIAVFAAFINLIPYIGPMIGATFGLLLGLGQAYALDPNVAFGLIAGKIALVFAITQLTDNFVYQPLIFSNSINAHPLEIFIVISIAGLMGGILGMVIAVPGYSMLRIIAKEFLSNSKFVQGLTKNV
jgi:predicted PurR-regulated permease PerM